MRGLIVLAVDAKGWRGALGARGDSRVGSATPTGSATTSARPRGAEGGLGVAELQNLQADRLFTLSQHPRRGRRRFPLGDDADQVLALEDRKGTIP